MRISDWSSDVCSSDLDQQAGGADQRRRRGPFEHAAALSRFAIACRRVQQVSAEPAAMTTTAVGSAYAVPETRVSSGASTQAATISHIRCGSAIGPRKSCAPSTVPPRVRSEEHTSELQTLMRISYAHLSLKKKNTH